MKEQFKNELLFFNGFIAVFCENHNLQSCFYPEVIFYRVQNGIA